jgi:Transglutaminase-like superfamily
MTARRAAVSLVAFVLAVAALVALGDRHDAPRLLKRAAAVGGYLDNVRSRNAFRRVDSAGSYEVQYGFIDHPGESHDVACRISRQAHERLVARYGYTERELEAATTAAQQAYADEELRRRGLAAYFRMDVTNDSVTSRRNLAEPGRWAELSPARQAEMDAAVAWLRADIADRTGDFERPFLKGRGFRLDGKVIGIDYPLLVDWSGPAVDACAKALRWEGAGYDERQYLGMFVAFVQEIRYELPPDVQAGRETLGYWVPTEVLVNGHGDCDSKAVTFCALYRGFGIPMIVVVLPRHVLVGVAATPGPGQQFVRLGNRYYVLCEVAGPGKFYPGEGKVEGNFRFMTVAPTTVGS